MPGLLFAVAFLLGASAPEPLTRTPRETKTQNPPATRGVPPEQTVRAPGAGGATADRQTATRSDAVRFMAPAFAATGLIFDAVSQRFVIADGGARKLMVVSARGGGPIDMVRADSAGFVGVSAIEIDERRGELWVAGGAGAVHRLQLVSGRPLRTYRPSPSLGDIELVDIGLAASGALVGLDAERGRVLVLGRGASEWQLSLPVALTGLTSIAVEEEGLVFVAHEGGLARLDLRSHQVTPLSAVPGVELQGIERVRLGTRALIAIQRASNGARRVVVLRLDDAGRRVTRATVVDEEQTPLTGPPSIHVVGRDLYYLAAEAQTSTERPYVVRKLSLR